MRKAWWKEQADLDDAQQSVVALSSDGNYLLTGPPGSGKTNLLLLRAAFLSASGLKDVLFLTVGRSLQEFISTGVRAKGLIDANQVMTVRKWAMRHLREYSPQFMKDPPSGDYDESRSLYEKELERVNARLPRLYNAILIDEVQDLTKRELTAIARLTNRIMVAGDERQQIYSGSDGLDAALALGCQHIALEHHYRIGRNICTAADSVLPPATGAKSLLQTCNYDERALPSSVKLHAADGLDSQIAMAIKEIRIQLRAYPDEAIGVLLPRTSVLTRARELLDASDLRDLVVCHESSGERDFPEDKRIFVMGVHSAKGTEFRAVHILGAEGFRGHLESRRVVFTAFTRAKTSLAVYHTGTIPAFIRGAFAKPTTPKLSDLF